jgi:sugar/nucleoside kinase (ribokinase family)
MLDEHWFQGATLCVVGNINRDVKPGPLRAGENLFRDGETSVATFSETIGGGGANSAFAAASLGARVAFAGKVGRDADGARLERTLTRHGIAPYLPRDPLHATGASVALSFEDGHRHFISCLPASRTLSFGDIDLGALRGREHLLRADIWFSESMLFEGNKLLFQAARRAGLAVSIDLNWDPSWGRAPAPEIAARKQAVRDVLPWVNIAHGNIRELTEFADAPDLDTALRRLADWGAGAAVVHLGERGAGYFAQGSLVTEPPAPIKERLHAAGTGDILSVCMMLLAARAELPVPERLRLSNVIVAEYIEGSRQLIPSLED